MLSLGETEDQGILSNDVMMGLVFIAGSTCFTLTLSNPKRQKVVLSFPSHRGRNGGTQN